MNLLDLMVRIGVDDQASSKVEGITSGAIAKGVAMGNAMWDVTKQVAGAVAGAAKSVVGGAVEAYSTYEQMVGGVDKLFGDASGKLQQYAAQAYQTSGMSANQYMEQATGFSAALINSLGGDTAKAADMADVAMRAMSDNVNVFGSNAEDVQNAIMGISRQNFSMIDNLKLGYSGTREGMEQLIADANAWGAANGEASDLSIDSFADCVQAIQQVQEAQGIAGTTAKEAAGTIEGSVTMAKAAWENLLTGLADPDADVGKLVGNLLGAVDNVVTNVAPRVGQVFTTVVSYLPTAVSQVGQTLLPVVADAAAGLVGDIAQNIVPALQGAMQTIHDAIYQGQAQLLLNFGIDVSPVVNAVERIKNAAEQAFGSIDVSGLMSGLEALGGAAESIGAAFAGLNLAPLFDGIAAGINAVIAVLEPCGERLQEVFSDPTVQQALQLLVDLLGLVANAIGVVLGAAITDAVELFSELLTTVSQVIVGITDFVMMVVQFFTGDLPAAFQGFQQAADSAMSEAGAAISDFVTQAVQFFTGDLPAAFQGFQTAADSAMSEAGAAIGSFVASAISAIGSFVSSAISAAAQAGSGFLSGIQSFFGQVPGAIAGFIASAVSVLMGLAGRAASAAANAGQSFLSAIRGGFNAAVSFVGSIPSRIVSAIGNVGGILYEAGSSIISGFLNGLKSAWGRVTDFVGGIADWIASHKGPIEYDRRLLVPHGRAIMAGLGEGLERAFGSDVVPLVSGLGGRLADAMATGSPGLAWATSRAGSPYPAPARTTVVNQSFNTRVVRSDQDMYAAAAILSRSAMRTAMEVS